MQFDVYKHMPSASQDDFLPTASWENLRLRAELLRRLREFFHENGFLEVETPVLSADTVVDRHLDPFYTEISIAPGKPPQRLWLQTSPEFGMKRLLAAGAKAIYQVSRVFRQGELGPLHNPEFTMVEWYRSGDGVAQGMKFTSDLAEAMLGRGPARQISYREAFCKYAGVDPLSSDTSTLIAAAKNRGIEGDCPNFRVNENGTVPFSTKIGTAPIEAPHSLANDDRDGWLDLLLVERVQPHLGQDCPVLLYDFPATQAALSRIRNDDPPVAERFELYVSGVELANGYHELLDAEELMLRNRETNRLRSSEGKSTIPEETRLLAAMQSGLPPAVGVALGFDRLVMLAIGAKNLADVVAFPFDRA